MISIARSLAEASTKYARRAIESYVGGDFEDFYLSAGISLEQAMKSRLARINIAFIAPDRNFKSALALWVTREDVSQLPLGTQTIGGAEALARINQIEPSFNRHAESVKQILRFRNGEAHVGAPGATAHRRVFADFAGALTSLLRVPAEEFWGEHEELIRIAVDDTAADVAKEVSEKLAGARISYRDRYEALGASQREALLAIAEQDANRQAQDDTLVMDCPACSSPALLHGENFVEFDVDYDHREMVELSAYPYIEFRGQQLECPACGLELDGQEEVEAAGLDAVFVNDHADVDEYMREYYS